MVKKETSSENFMHGCLKKLYFRAVLLLMMGVSMCVQRAYADIAGNSATATQQITTITGTVTDEAGAPLTGVAVVAKGTSAVSLTGIDGKYSIDISGGADAVLQFTYPGYVAVEVPVGARRVVDVVMTADAYAMDEVVVTGVLSGTPKSKLAFTVEKVGGAKLSAVPAMSAASSLQGKIAGIQIFSNSGNPNEDPVIQLRGSASFIGTSQPLIIVDGIITEGGLKDINAEDIVSMEVLKGSAAAAFYGAKAANGVIQVITRRGNSLRPGEIIVGLKSEVGVTFQQFKPLRTTAHRFATDPVTGMVDKSREDPDQIEDNKFEHYFGDPYDIFTPTTYHSTIASLIGNSEKGISYYGSFQYQNRGGVVDILKGVQRKNIRLNLDHQVNKKFSWSASNSFISSKSDDNNINFDDVFYSDPNVNLWEPNLDGTPYKYQPNIISTRNNVNPLYVAANRLSESTQTRFMGGYSLTYRPINHLSLNGMYSIDSRTNNYMYLDPAGLLTSNNPDGARSTGYMYMGDDNNMKQNLSLDAIYARSFGDFNLRLKAGATFEDYRWDGKWTSGSNLALQGKDVVSLDLIDPETMDAWSGGGKTTSQSYSAMFMGDFKDKYMIDLLVRRDGVSVVGANERWQTYYRLSGAWNIMGDFPIRGIDYLKPRVSYGTAGVYPSFGAQYETYDLSNGSLGAPGQLGNKNLTPALSQELEIGLDAKLFGRIDITASYARKRNTNLIFVLPVSSVTGFAYQTQNIGEFFGRSFEVTVNARIMERKNFSWDATITWDRMVQKVGELGQDEITLESYFKIRSGERIGNMYGSALATSLDQVKTSTLIKPGQSVEDVFTINNYGWVVRKDLVGTRDEARVAILDENGNTKSDNLIGYSQPDFVMNLANTINWKRFQLYFNLSWKQGGDTFNNTLMYMSFAGENAYLRDMSERPWSQRKAKGYVSHARAQMTENSSFLRLRELSLGYSFDNQQLSMVKLGFIKGIRIAAVARNLFTLTKFSGTDPESRTMSNDTYTAFDTPKYPGGATVISGQLSIEF